MASPPATPPAEDAGKAVSPPAGTETYLFTDIEGSTRLLQLLGDRFSELLLEHRRLLIGAIQRGGGREAGTAGDGSFAVFRSARDAVLAAVAAQRALAAHPWPEGAAVRVRMGMHTGESGRADDIYTGLDVYRAARIGAAGHGGQVLLSEATRQLVQRELPPDVSLRDLGEHRLKDLEQPEHLWQLVIAGLPAEFPPLKSLGTRPNNLPTAATPLIGRETELAGVVDLLRRDSVRLATLTGPGGIGKTRLALECARRLLDSFPDGVFLVALGSATDPEVLPSRIAESLQLMENPARTVLDSLKDLLRPRSTLLVLDNFEQLLAAAPVVAELLQHCPGLKALVTSRVVLHLRGEYEYPVPPLPVPDPRRLPTVERLAEYPAVQLFVTRARAVKPDFELSPDNAAAVATICAGLDGLPLAVELAAARIKLFSPHAMVTRLERRLDLLKGGARDLPARQQTLRQAIAWSFDLLGADQRTFFCRLSVFRGGCALDHVEQVCSAPGALDLDAIEALSLLVDSSLLRQVEGPGGEPRFLMLDTIREFGAECLAHAADAEQVRQAHADCFLRLAEQAEPELTGQHQGFWFDRLETERDNLSAALEWCVTTGHTPLALRLGAALWRFWVSRGHLREGRQWLERLASLPAETSSPARAELLLGAGTIMHESGEYSEARRLLGESLVIWRELGNTSGMANVLNNLGWIASVLGNLDEADALSREGLALSQQVDDKRGMGVATHNLAWTASFRGDYATAMELQLQAIAFRTQAGDRRGEAYMQVDLADLEQMQGNLAEARRLADAAAATLQELGDRQIGAWATQVQGRIAYAEGDLEQARRLLEECGAVWDEIGNQDALCWNLADLARIFLDMGRPAEASSAAARSLALAKKTGAALSRIEAFPVAGWVALEQNSPALATQLFEQALDLNRSLGNPRRIAEALEGLAEVQLRLDDAAAASRLLAEAESLRSEARVFLRPTDRARSAARRAAIDARLARAAAPTDSIERPPA